MVQEFERLITLITRFCSSSLPDRASISRNLNNLRSPHEILIYVFLILNEKKYRGLNFLFSIRGYIYYWAGFLGKFFCFLVISHNQTPSFFINFFQSQLQFLVYLVAVQIRFHSSVGHSDVSLFVLDFKVRKKLLFCLLGEPYKIVLYVG